jgi:hypothetical protein
MSKAEEKLLQVEPPASLSVEVSRKVPPPVPPKVQPLPLPQPLLLLTAQE